jgi:LuxR family maltose regulon positive regulatory protein
MARLLRALAAQPEVPLAVAALLAAFPAHAAPTIPQPPGLVDLLSPREREILALLVERNSNKEIADRLYIAPSTVKSHTLNLYRKLEVTNRRQAVARAQMLGLLADGQEREAGVAPPTPHPT